ncbi:MAG: glycoside hydrolase family 30 beta sandwich domain-containing protein [Solirubrobacteraceae bacterium]
MAAVLLLALGPASAGAGKPVAGRALVVRSLRAVGDRSLGLVVTATFAGDVEHALGRGALRGAGLLLVLERSSRVVSALLDERGGAWRVAVPAVRGLVSDEVAPDRVLATAAARGITVLRDGDRVLFDVPASDLRGASGLRLEVLSAGARAASLGARGWRKLMRAPAVSRAAVAMPAALTCARLRATIIDRTDVSPVDLEPLLVEAQRRAARLRSALAHVGVRAGGGAEAGLRAAIARALSDTRQRIARLRREAAGIAGVSERLNARIRGCASAPGAGPPAAPAPSAGATSATTPSSPAPARTVGVVQTDAALGQDMAAQPAVPLLPAPAPSTVPVIAVAPQIRYQTFAGLGAAMTDSSAWLLNQNLPAAAQAQVMGDLFGTGPAAIHLNFLRVPMGASDFTVSPTPYAYDDVAQGNSDVGLRQFSIGHDLTYIIPAIKQALGVNPALHISANPWSPPAWMKANDALDNNNLAGTLLTQYYDQLADYFVRFIQDYAAQGVQVADIVPQNEPRAPGGSGTPYPGLTLPEADEARFISQHLAPVLAAAGLSPKLYGNDLSWDKFSAYAQPLAASPARPDLTGIAWHCYAGNPSVMTQLHTLAPGVDQIIDECSPEIRNFGAAEFLISVLRNWATEAAVWNVALDPQGGPKQSNNGCPGCIGLVTVNEQSQSYSFNTEYYQLGQVSAFVQPGAVRIDSPNFVAYSTNKSNILAVSSGLDDVAFLNPDGSKVLIAYDNSTSPISFAVQDGAESFTDTIPPGAMTTFTWS